MLFIIIILNVFKQYIRSLCPHEECIIFFEKTPVKCYALQNELDTHKKQRLFNLANVTDYYLFIYTIKQYITKLIVYKYFK